MPVRSIRTYTVLPSIPERLKPLQTLANNLWWCWNAEAVALFRRIDPDLFEALDHSPIRLLTTLEQKRFVELLADDAFLAHMDPVRPTPTPRSRTSGPCSAFTRACRFTPAASACSPATT